MGEVGLGGTRVVWGQVEEQAGSGGRNWGGTSREVGEFATESKPSSQHKLF